MADSADDVLAFKGAAEAAFRILSKYAGSSLATPGVLPAVVAASSLVFVAARVVDAGNADDARMGNSASRLLDATSLVAAAISQCTEGSYVSSRVLPLSSELCELLKKSIAVLTSPDFQTGPKKAYTPLIFTGIYEHMSSVLLDIAGELSGSPGVPSRASRADKRSMHAVVAMLLSSLLRSASALAAISPFCKVRPSPASAPTAVPVRRRTAGKTKGAKELLEEAARALGHTFDVAIKMTLTQSLPASCEELIKDLLPDLDTYSKALDEQRVPAETNSPVTLFAIVGVLPQLTEVLKLIASEISAALTAELDTAEFASTVGKRIVSGSSSSVPSIIPSAPASVAAPACQGLAIVPDQPLSASSVDTPHPASPRAFSVPEPRTPAVPVPEPPLSPSEIDERIKHTQSLVEAVVLRSWLASPAIVFWLICFGHSLQHEAAPVAAASAAARAEDDEDPIRAGGPSFSSGTSAPYNVVTDDESRRVSSAWSRASGAAAAPARDDSHATLTGASAAPMGSETGAAFSAHSAAAAPRVPPVSGTGPSGDPAIVANAGVPLEELLRCIKANVNIDDDVLTLVRNHNAFGSLGRRIGVTSAEVRPDVAPDGPCNPPSVNLDDWNSSQLVFRSGHFTMPFANREHLDSVVTLIHFDRFVRVCAEPTAQAAWHLLAERAVKAAASLAFQAMRESGATAEGISDLLVSGRLVAIVAYAAASALLPYSAAVITSAFSGYAHGGCAGAWTGFLPREHAERLLLAQAAVEGPGAFLLRLSRSRACEVAISYVTTVSTAPASAGHAGFCDGGGVSRSSGGTAASPNHLLCVTHEILPLSLSGNGVVLRGVEYPAPGHAVCANPSFLGYPCFSASLAIADWPTPALRTVASEGAPLAAPLMSYDALMRAAQADAIDAREQLHREGAGDQLFRFVGSLPLLAAALFGEAGLRSPAAMTQVPEVIGIIEFCEAEQSGPRNRFSFPPGMFDRLCRAAACALTTVLPDVTGPEALASTAWAGALSPPPLPPPMSAPTVRIPNIFACDGYHGTLSKTQTLARLTHMPPGTYLIRASQSERGSVVLAIVDCDGKVQQYLFSPDPDPASSGTGKVQCRGGQVYSSIRHVIDALSENTRGRAFATLLHALQPASVDVTLNMESVSQAASAFSAPIAFEVACSSDPVAALHSSFRDESSPIASQHRTTHSETTEFRTSLLVKAAKVGDTDKVRRLLALNTEVSARRAPVPSLLEPYQAGLTPLLWAAHFGHVDVVRLLLADHRVNPLDTCALGFTALHWAAEMGREDVCDALLCDVRVDPRSQDKVRRVPDQSERIIVDTIRSLTFVTQHGWTALHRASAKGFVGIVRRLLHDGRCDVNARDKDGFTPLQRVVLSGSRHDDVRDLLRPH